MSNPDKHAHADPAARAADPAADPAAAAAGDNGGADAATSDAGLAEAFAKELAEARRTADDNWDRYLRAEADLENFRKRAERLREEAVARTRRELLVQVLEVGDNLRRALGYQGADDQALRPGVEGTLRQLERVLQLAGVTAIDAANAVFDPEIHEAMAVVEMPELDGEQVVQVEREGYRLNGELLRPARVVVGRPPEIGD